MQLHPFRALHPTPETAARVASPPYDVVSTAEASAIAGENVDSFLHVVRPEIDLPEGTSLYDDSVYAMAKQNLEGLVARGALVKGAAPAIWLYRLTMGSHVQTGFFGASSVDDYVAGKIKKHEFTRPDKENDRTRHVDTLGANAGPVFLTCHEVGDGELAALQASLIEAAGAPFINIVGQHDVRHELWPISAADGLEQVAAAFAKVEAFYIADGHHRAASAMRTRDLRRKRDPSAPKDAPFERFGTVVFPAPQVAILAYNRVVSDLNGLTTDGLIAALGTHFDVERGGDGTPTARHAFGLYIDGAWWTLRAKASTVDESDPIARLDVSIIQDNVLGPLLGIDDPRTSKRVAFVGGIRGAAALAAQVDANGGCAISMFATSVEELLAVADAGSVMPPKSTWFEPKLASGLLTYTFE